MKEERRLYKKRYYLKHKDAIRQYQKIYRQMNKEKLNKKCRLYYKNHCGQQQEMRQIIMHNLKINGCAICGYDKCDAALIFHHANPDDKKFDMAQRILQRSNNIIIDELNKCILLCCICHRELHHNGGD